LITSVIVLASLGYSAVFAQDWVQTGVDIDGEASEDSSGWSVSLSADDGTRLAIGAMRNDGNGDGAGHVRVHEWTGTAWIQLGSDIDGEAAGDSFGTSVSISTDGSRLAVGGPGNCDGCSFNVDLAGHVRVFEWSGSDWIQLGGDIDGEAPGDYSGESVSISGDGSRVAIGAARNSGNGAGAGHVRVYEWSGAAWTQLGSDIDGEAEGDASGTSVSLSWDGGRVAIGAIWNSDSDDSAGHVRVYEWTGSSWAKVGTDIDGQSAYDLSGKAVAISADGNRLAVGGDTDEMQIYEWTGIEWLQLGSNLFGKTVEHKYGRSVSLSSDGSRVAISGIGNWVTGEQAGYVRVFEWSGTEWIQLGADMVGEGPSDRSGKSVSITADGGKVAIGAPDNSDNGASAGHARVFEWIEGLVYMSGFDDLALGSINGQDGWCVGPSPSITADPGLDNCEDSLDGAIVEEEGQFLALASTPNKVLEIVGQPDWTGYEVGRILPIVPTKRYLTIEMDFKALDDNGFWFMAAFALGGHDADVLLWESNIVQANSVPGTNNAPFDLDTWHSVGMEIDQLSREITAVMFDGFWAVEDDTDGIEEPWMVSRLMFRGLGPGVRLWIDNLSFIESDTPIFGVCESNIGVMCPPSEDPQVYITNNGLDVQINGGVSAPPPCEPVARIEWDWGDGSSNDFWFPAAHSYTELSDYTITTTAYDSKGNAMATDSCDISLEVITANGFE
jgi:hypothetical protein